MIRYSFLVLAALASAATAFAAVHPQAASGTQEHINVTVMEKNSPFPVLGPLVVEDCALEDCSDTQS